MLSGSNPAATRSFQPISVVDHMTDTTVLTRRYSSTLGKYHGSNASGSRPLSLIACQSAALTPIMFIPPPISTASFPVPSCTRSERHRSRTAAGEVLHQ
jgi:hypothetical protein